MISCFKKIIFCFPAISAILIFASCSKSGPANIPVPPPALPTVGFTSGVPLIVSTTFVTIGGNVTSDGRAAVTARGICWADAPNPTVAGNHTVNGTGLGTFTGLVQGLTPGVVYFARSYATNSVGTAYSNEISFTTTPNGGGPSNNFYASGDLYSGLNSMPTSWKNGAPSPLALPNSVAQANSVFFYGTSVYVTGYERNGVINTARLWKDGNGIFLTNGFNWESNGRSVFVSGQDVYVAGEVKGPAYDIATIWKNGVATFLTGGTSSGVAHSVYVEGNDVYVSGYEGNVAKTWKNGVAVSLTDGTNAAVAYSIKRFYPDMYVAGTEMSGTKTAARIWKNGIGSSLTNGNFNAGAFSVYIYGSQAGTDVYVVGYEHNGTKNVAKVWKNGVATNLTDGTNDAMALSVHGFGLDIYVGGYENDGTKNVPKVWKNGLEIFLQNSSDGGKITGLFVN